jgi:transcriptional regulator with XRE-family HTH domain
MARTPLSFPANRRVLGRALSQLRHEAGLTQEELANRAKLHYTYIGRIERGEQNPGWETVAKIVWGLGVSFVEFSQKIDALIKAKAHHPRSWDR